MVLDMATSAMPIFKVAEALLKGEALPPNVGYDAAGVPTQAPKEILVSGALMTFDRGPKSSGLALIVELLQTRLREDVCPVIRTIKIGETSPLQSIPICSLVGNPSLRMWIGRWHISKV